MDLNQNGKKKNNNNFVADTLTQAVLSCSYSQKEGTP